MSRLFLNTLFSCFLLFQTASFAEEGDIDPLLVPEASSEVVSDEEAEVAESPTEQEEPVDKDIPSEEEVSTEEAEVAENTSSPEEDTQVEQAEEPQVQEEEVAEEAPSEDELEAKRAEEAELREVGAGEEPAIE